MAKNAVADWDTSAGNNTDVGGVNIAEGMSPGNVNNAMREIMAQVAAWRSLVGQLGDNETVTGTWTFSTMPVIPDLGVTGPKLANSAVTTAKIGDAQVTAAKIGDAQVTFAKLAPAAVVTGAEGIAANDNDTTLPTSAAVKDVTDAIAATVPGVSQTWQDVTASRTHSTSYQNTTGREIFVHIRGSTGSTRFVQASVDNSTWVEVGVISSALSINSENFPVPPGHFYRVDGSFTINSWTERR